MFPDIFWRSQSVVSWVGFTFRLCVFFCSAVVGHVPFCSPSFVMFCNFNNSFFMLFYSPILSFQITSLSALPCPSLIEPTRVWSPKPSHLNPGFLQLYVSICPLCPDDVHYAHEQLLILPCSFLVSYCGWYPLGALGGSQLFAVVMLCESAVTFHQQPNTFAGWRPCWTAIFLPAKTTVLTCNKVNCLADWMTGTVEIIKHSCFSLFWHLKSSQQADGRVHFPLRGCSWA